MVKVKYLVIVVSVLYQGCVGWPQEAQEVSPPPVETGQTTSPPPLPPTPSPTPMPTQTTTPTPAPTSSYQEAATDTPQPTTYPPATTYAPQPTTYPPTTYPPVTTYAPQPTTYPPTSYPPATTYVPQPTTYPPTTYPPATTYAPTTAGTKEPDYGTPYFDYTWHYDSDYDEEDSNNKVQDSEDTSMQLLDDMFFKEMGLPWVYVIMPVIEVEVYYINENEHGVESVGFEVPVETILLDLLEFGESALSEMIFGDWDADYGEADSYSYHHSHGHGHYGDYDVPASLYDSGDQLFDPATLDYPAGIDHDTAWVDWLFQLPPDQLI